MNDDRVPATRLPHGGAALRSEGAERLEGNHREGQPSSVLFGWVGETWKFTHSPEEAEEKCGTGMDAAALCHGRPDAELRKAGKLSG